MIGWDFWLHVAELIGSYKVLNFFPFWIIFGGVDWRLTYTIFWIAYWGFAFILILWIAYEGKVWQKR